MEWRERERGKGERGRTVDDDEGEGDGDVDVGQFGVGGGSVGGLEEKELGHGWSRKGFVGWVVFVGDDQSINQANGLGVAIFTDDVIEPEKPKAWWPKGDHERY